jgi:hypothetical protein
LLLLLFDRSVAMADERFFYDMKAPGCDGIGLGTDTTMLVSYVQNVCTCTYRTFTCIFLLLVASIEESTTMAKRSIDQMQNDIELYGQDITLLSRCGSGSGSAAMETLENTVSEEHVVSSSVKSTNATNATIATNATNATNASTTTTTTTTVTTMITPLQDSNILQNIISFVGQNQYRFVAAVNRDFQAVYLQLFPDNKHTYYNASSVGHATLCYNDLAESNEVRLPRPDFTRTERRRFRRAVSKQKNNIFKQGKLMTSAAKYGNLSALQYLRSVDCYWDERTCTVAVHNGHLTLLQWAHAHGCLWSSDTCAKAAEIERLDILQWARTNGCPWDVSTCHAAAKNGNLAMLQWAHANGCPWDKSTCNAAARNGHLAVLQWARRNGCPWDMRTCVFAALNGHLHVLQWARKNGCPWDSKTCAAAAFNGCPWDSSDKCRTAALSCNFLVFQWVLDNGCPWDRTICAQAAELGYTHVLEWAEKYGYS